MKNLAIILLSTNLISCATCGEYQDNPPNIRTQPGIEYCDDMCNLFEKMDCKPYYENINLDDGGTITCTDFCIYELTNSVPLNPKCIVENLKNCSEIENICK